MRANMEPLIRDYSLNRLFQVLQNEGVGGLLRRIEVRLMRYLPKLHGIYKALFPHRSRNLRLLRDAVSGKRGIEFGGPSHTFSDLGLCPIYDCVGALDNCTFSSHTFWEGELQDGAQYRFSKKKTPGTQFVRDTSQISDFPDASYDFVLSCHMLEHSANPLKVLLNWHRMIRRSGICIAILPHYEETFDHLRPVTTLTHLIEDYERSIDEDDQTHFSEILKSHDLVHDGFLTGTDVYDQAREFESRVFSNFQHRMLHHHVFDTELALRLFDHAGFHIISVEPERPNNIVLLLERPAEFDPDFNIKFLSQSAGWRRKSTFRRDRLSTGSKS